MTARAFAEIVPLDIGEFWFPEDEPWAGELGVVVAYAIRRREGVLLFDTGFGFGSPELEERYRQTAGGSGTSWPRPGSGWARSTSSPTATSTPTMPARTRVVTYIEAEGDHELVPGIRVVSTPGHSPGHQSLVVDQRAGPVVLTGQAVYGLDEWRGTPGREGATSAADRSAYDASLARLCAIDPSRVLFAHDRRPWSR
jgi:glyoxylase-like metal-dependent hydrolase (beta-lactamase superfamily II)